MNEKDRILNELALPQTLEDALKFAKSLAYWIEYIQLNPHKVDEPMGSFGGHIEGHLIFLQAWFEVEKLRVVSRSLTDK